MNTLRPVIAWSSAVRLALLAATIGAAACLWWAWCHFPQLAWNEVRLAPAFALRHGVSPYPPLGGGPLFTWIYPPVGLLLNLPATLAQSATGALQLACLVNFLVVLGPLAVVFAGSAELRARGASTVALAFALGVLLVPSPNLVLQVADHAAIAFGLLSCWVLAQAGQPGPRALAAAAGLGTLAVWSKQTAVFLFAGQFVFLLLGPGRRQAFRYAAWVAGGNIFAAAVAAAAFGPGQLWLNLVTIPARLPWADVAERLAQRPAALVAQLLLPSLGLLLLWRTGRWPADTTVSGRFFRVAVAVYVAVLPVGLAAYCKIGGDTNLLHSWSYLMPALLLAWLAGTHRVAAAALPLLAVTAGALALHWPRFSTLPGGPHTGHLTMAEGITAQYPDAVWFPQNPVITFYAGGRLWHSEDGIVTRELAGCGLTGPDFRPHLPPKLRAVAYPVFNQTHAAMSLLPTFNRTIELPYWILLVPPPPAPVRE